MKFFLALFFFLTIINASIAADDIENKNEAESNQQQSSAFSPEALNKSFLKSYEFLDDLNLSPGDRIDLQGDPEDFVLIFLQEKVLVIFLYANEAPETVKAFKAMVRSGFYNNTSFFRYIPNYLIQGGDPTDSGYGGRGLLRKAELTDKLTFKRGSVAMANSGNMFSDDSQFFITFNAFPWLNGKNTIFGFLISGLSYLESLNGTYDANGYLSSVVIIERAVVYSDYLKDPNHGLDLSNNTNPNINIIPDGPKPQEDKNSPNSDSNSNNPPQANPADASSNIKPSPAATKK